MIEILMKAPLFEHVSSDAIFGFLEKSRIGLKAIGYMMLWLFRALPAII